MNLFDAWLMPPGQVQVRKDRLEPRGVAISVELFDVTNQVVVLPCTALAARNC